MALQRDLAAELARLDEAHRLIADADAGAGRYTRPLTEIARARSRVIQLLAAQEEGIRPNGHSDASQSVPLQR